MYNFENRGFLSQTDTPLAEFNKFEKVPGHFMNHFPVREMTWAMREQFWPQGIWGYFRTRFQGRELLTKCRLEPWQGEGWHFIRVESEFHPAHD